MTVLTSLTDPALIHRLRSGEIGVLPTDTIYGIVARAEDPNAVARLYAAKHREGKPGTVIAASTEQLQVLGIDPDHLRRVGHLWPNPISIVLPSPSHLAYLDQGKQSLAVRVTNNPQLRTLLEQTGPLLTSSANMPGEPPASTVGEAQRYFGDKVDFYVDGGDMADRPASTVARLLPDGTLEVLRQGAVTISEETIQ